VDTEDSVIYEGRQTASHTAEHCQRVIQLDLVVQVDGDSNETHRPASCNLPVSRQLHRLYLAK